LFVSGVSSSNMWLNLAALEALLETGSIGRRIVYLSSTGSTMDVARSEAEAGAVDGTIVIAEEQTSGRGRFGRSWVSPAGKNLYFTLVLRPPSPDAVSVLAMATPLAVCRALESVPGLTPRIKWPNDILLSGRKVSGVLIENELAGSNPRFSLVGVGLNVNFEIPPDSEIAGIATSVRSEVGEDVHREDLLASILNYFESWYPTAKDTGAVLTAWKQRLDTLGQRVTVTFGDQTYEGTADDVDAKGSLLLRRDDGTLVTLEAGEVTLRPPAQ
jgi:BirA family biotin operon repressor/biotin-[acetyl-CoA-carboxylase] ligase